jgi:hypothetical protein
MLLLVYGYFWPTKGGLDAILFGNVALVITEAANKRHIEAANMHDSRVVIAVRCR